MRVLNTLAGLALIVAPVQVMAQDGSDYKLESIWGGWAVVRGKSDCQALANFPNDENLFIGFNDKLGRVELMFSERSVKSLNEGDKRKMNVYLLNPPEGRSLGPIEFTVKVLNEKRYFLANMPAEKMLSDLSRYPTLAFLYNSTLLSRFDLDGLPAAITALRKCSLEQSLKNPSDIFAN